MVIGGGATGVELACEIGAKYRGGQKNITLLHAKNHFVDDAVNNKRFQDKLDEILTRYQIRTVTGELVENIEEVPSCGPGTVVTNKGTKISADLIFKTAGLFVNTEAYQNGLGKYLVFTAYNRKKNTFTLHFVHHVLS